MTDPTTDDAPKDTAPTDPGPASVEPSGVNGGDLVARVLEAHGVGHVFTLCGGHISPILVEAKARGIAVIDVRHEATAVFAADAMARLTGVPGVAAVTAGPGVTNTVTPLQNAKMAESPLVLLGGATPTVLEGRGALQDIDQMTLVKPLVKAAWAVTRYRDIAPVLEEAFRVAREGVPGPVFVQLPVDLLYDQALIDDFYGGKIKGTSLGARLLRTYLRFHSWRLFAGASTVRVREPLPVAPPRSSWWARFRAGRMLARARRPLLVLGSGVMAEPERAEAVARAVEALGVPVYLGGMSRGLLGAGHPLHLRHGRTKALRRSDLVLLAGFPMDFRLDYGRKIPGSAKLVNVNRDPEWLTRNRRPDLAVLADPGRFLGELAERAGDPPPRWEAWRQELAEADRERDAEIAAKAEAETVEPIHPLELLREVERVLPEDSVLVADGGDFVGTASYVVRPRGPLRWLDPGAFGTLGVGAGFALGAQLHRPQAEVWLLWGDGSAGYGLAELDTFVRHGLPVIAVVGNDAGWTQIAREQVEILGDDVATALAHSDYQLAAEAFGGVGLRIDRPEQIPEVLAEARRHAAAGKPVIVNAVLGVSDFRKGSISM